MSKSITPAKARKRFRNYLNRVDIRVALFKEDCTNAELRTACDMIYENMKQGFTQAIEQPDDIVQSIYENRHTALIRILAFFNFHETNKSQFSDEENKSIFQIFSWGI